MYEDVEKTAFLKVILVLKQKSLYIIPIWGT